MCSSDLSSVGAARRNAARGDQYRAGWFLREAREERAKAETLAREEGVPLPIWEWLPAAL